MTDLPSNKEDPEKEEARRKARRDERATDAAGLRSWEAKKVRVVVTCYLCGKRRCMYARLEEQWARARVALEQKLEMVGHRYCCGDLIFEDSHPMSKILVQRENISYLTRIEPGHYNVEKRHLKLKDVGIHCGALDSTPSGYLLGLGELQRKCVTGGYPCRPICKDCFRVKGEKGVVKWGKKDTMQERMEKEQKQKKKEKEKNK